MKNKIVIITSGILCLLSWMLLIFSRCVEGFARWYSTTIYPGLVNTIGRVFGLVPFSVIELLLYIFIIVLIISTICIVTKKVDWKDAIVRASLTISILFFLYVTNCGINYQRDSFSECVGLEIEEYTVEELAEVCRILTEDVNVLSNQVRRDEDGVMKLTGNTQQDAVTVMKMLAKNYPEMEGYYPQPKGLLNPWILAVQQLSGIYSPFTIEANYNSGMVDYNIPFTMCHELSHLRGFMQEQEANFIAYLACVESENVEFQYSGSMLGWIYCMNVLYKVDYERWEEIRETLNPLADVDLKVNSEYWNQYDGAVAEMADKVNDTYLKANGQADGVQSYNRMVDLMVMYYR